MTEPTRKNLIQRCAGVMAAVEHVPKRGRNTFHNYDYATEADIADAVRSEMARQEIMLIPSVVKAEFREAQTKSGTERAVTLTVRYTLTDGVESREFEVLGEGQDRGDKATYKAMTGATKYALLKLFLISTGDDPEADDGEKPPPAKGKPAQPAPPAKTVPAAESLSPVKALWARAVKEWGEAARKEWDNATVKALGDPIPSAKWSDDQTKMVEAELFRNTDIPF